VHDMHRTSTFFFRIKGSSSFVVDVADVVVVVGVVAVVIMSRFYMPDKKNETGYQKYVRRKFFSLLCFMMLAPLFPRVESSLLTYL